MMGNTTTIAFRVAPEEKAKLAELAGREGKTLSEFLANLVKTAVQESPPPPTPADDLTAEIGKVLSDPDSRRQFRDMVKSILKEVENELEVTPLDHAIRISKKEDENKKDEKGKRSRKVENASSSSQGSPDLEKSEEGEGGEANPGNDELSDEEWEEIKKWLNPEKPETEEKPEKGEKPEGKEKPEKCPECGGSLPPVTVKKLKAGETAVCPGCGETLKWDEGSTSALKKVGLAALGGLALLYVAAKWARSRGGA
jgi:hypothetical protein